MPRDGTHLGGVLRNSPNPLRTVYGGTRCRSRTTTPQRHRHLEIANAVSELERERNLAPGRIRFLAQIETPGALQRLAAIASAHPRMVAMSLGPEDFSAAVGGAPEFDLLLAPNLSVLFAARAAGLLPLGFIGSIGELS
ncbi:aldolase/citrate lyase family protein, partial [Mesorhizobium sp. VK25A]